MLIEALCFNTNQNCNDEIVRNMIHGKSKFVADPEAPKDRDFASGAMLQKVCLGRDKSSPESG